MIDSADNTISAANIADTGRAASIGNRRLNNAIAMLLCDFFGLIVIGNSFAWLWNKLGFVGRNDWIAVWIGMYLLTAVFVRLYPGYGLDAPERLRRSMNAAAVSGLAAASGLLMTQTSHPSIFAQATITVLVSVPLLLFGRWGFTHFLVRLKRWGVPVLVTGDDITARELCHTFEQQPALGYQPRYYSVMQIRHIARAMEAREGSLSSFAHGFGVEAVAFLVAPKMSHVEREGLLEGPLALFRSIYAVVDSPALDTGWASARYLGAFKVLELRRRHLEPLALLLKRGIDLLIVLAALPFGLLVMGIIALIVRLDSNGPIFYADERLGKRDKRFRCLKFRTMVVNAEAKLEEMLRTDPVAREEYSTYHKLKNDPRITRAGKFLRASSLDELPQIINVLLGQMSIVGPRPYLPRERPKMEPYAEMILSCPPGITGWWQVEARNKARFEERLQLDLLYVRRWSIWMDLIILVRTFTVVLQARGAY